MSKFFSSGATWLKADFHLHTKADKKFNYNGAESYYYSDYVNALKTADIRIGVVTNHNKFDYEEFKALQKTAKGKDILLLPGLELHVQGGRSGIHMLIVFSDDWIKNGNKIKTFLSAMFPGRSEEQYQKEQEQSHNSIINTVDELEKHGCDYFIIFPHVEDKKGLWEEMGGGSLQHWKNPRFKLLRERTLGFQQVRTQRSREQVKEWLGNKWYPAAVEGSDPTCVEKIGRKEHYCYLKIGSFTFDAVKFALKDHVNRVRSGEKPSYKHSHIKKIRFEGGTLDGKELLFSPELNTLVGIRGSGKSSIMEALRYVLGCPMDPNDNEYEYKQKLVERTLGSGGKVIVDAIDRHGQPYQVRRILKEASNVYIDGKLQPGLSIRETVLTRPLFFGQKELATAKKGSEKELIEKLIGNKCDEIRRQIAKQKVKTTDAIDKWFRMNNVEELIEEQTKIKHDANYRLNFYKTHNLEDKLQKRLDYDTDIRKANEGIALVQTFIDALEKLLENNEDDLHNFPGHISNNNSEIFNRINLYFTELIQNISSIKTVLQKSKNILIILKKDYEILIGKKNDMAEEFASVERLLAEELKTLLSQNISIDEFLYSKKKLASAEVMLAELSKNRNQKIVLKNEMDLEIQKLNNLWYEEFNIIKNELDNISEKTDALTFLIGHKEDKKAFLEYFKNIFKGSSIRDTTFQNITDKYTDFYNIYLGLENDFENTKKIFGSNPDKFIELFYQNLKILLTYQTPNTFTIIHQGKKLADHSLGQRASALILFIMGQRENDIIIIDQPEDDIDNQTIYDNVIKLIIQLKSSVQFIFATHNPNIPVLGDAEQIHVCMFVDEKITVQSGSIDEPTQQTKIVDIMEGGEKAFMRRKEIYGIWKP